MSDKQRYKLFVSLLHKETNDFEKAKEENKIVKKIQNLLSSMGYNFIITEVEK